MSGQLFYNILQCEDAAWQGMDAPSHKPLMEARLSLEKIIRQDRLDHPEIYAKWDTRSCP